MWQIPHWNSFSSGICFVNSSVTKWHPRRTGLKWTFLWNQAVLFRIIPVVNEDEECRDSREDETDSRDECPEWWPEVCPALAECDTYWCDDEEWPEEEDCCGCDDDEAINHTIIIIIIILFWSQLRAIIKHLFKSLLIIELLFDCN